jgi:UDP-N-acetylmuramoylalanine--D-glutamate ligase
MTDLRGTSVSVIGAARSGIAVAKLMKSLGAVVFVSDQLPAEALKAAAEEFRAAGIGFESSEHTERAYECTLMVISPGVPSDAPVVKEAHRRGIRVVSELEVSSWYCASPIVAITGSNGKTTTTTLIGRILGDAAKKHVVAGNIGTAFSGIVLDMDLETPAVLEVSSFQLDHIETFQPSIAVLLNITEDHMDRYDHSMEKYAASKARVFMNQTASNVLIYNADDAWTARVVASARSRMIGFSTARMLEEGAFVENRTLVARLNGVRREIVPVDEIGIKGMHNLSNAMAATLTGLLLGIDADSIRKSLIDFGGVEHRLEFVRKRDGIQYVNDSKATNVDSVWYALQAFTQPIVLLLGGRDKGNDYSRLIELVRTHVRTVVAIGESAETVERAFGNVRPVVIAKSMEEALAIASAYAQSGDVVLLSPACASFDWFTNYEHRGRVFKELVNTL